MFNLFKKSKNEQETVSKTVNGKYPQIVEEIHNEFNTAAERLLKEAHGILLEASTKNVSNKVSRLEMIGFKQAKEVSEIRPILEKAKLSKEQIELINYYAIHYPNNKFITEEQVKTICHKYNLVCGDVNRYTGFLPEKNLAEIERFKLNKEESATMLVEAFDGRKSIGIFEGKNLKIISTDSGYYHIAPMLFKPNSFREHSFQQNVKTLADEGDFYGVDYGNNFGLLDKGHINIRVLNKLQICAPVKDMDINGLSLKDGYKLEKHIPDPVVLHRVKGGYLILTAWGDEASDELVVNQKMN